MKKQITYFGIEVHNGCVYNSDIEKLPFYEFWKESSIGSTCQVIKNEKDEITDTKIYLQDWEAFCTLFIQTGKHRFSKS